jgi:hypothetical protein
VWEKSIAPCVPGIFAVVVGLFVCVGDSGWEVVISMLVFNLHFPDD